MISVIVPVYNADKYLKETIRSILDQTYRNFELILVNDGSTDGSMSIISEYMQYENLKVIDGANYGAPHARNEGMKIAEGEYIVFFDADDVMVSNHLKRFDEAIEKTTADIVICSHIL